MTEQRVPQGLIENLNNAMTAILDHLENNADRRADPEDIPLQALEIIEEEVAGFREYLGSGYDASGGSSWMREADGSTKKYDDDSALKGDQSKLPDGLQKGIIDKTVEDREEQEEKAKEDKNESIMRITKRQLKRIIRESILREQAEDSITVNALFKWDDYNYSGEPGEAREQVTISPEEFDEWGDDDWSGALMSWASENLDGGLEVSDIEVSPEDEARLTDWVGTQEAWTLDPTPPRAPGELPLYPGGVTWAIQALFKKNPDLQRLPPTKIAEMISGLGYSFREQGDELVDKVARTMRGEW